MLNKNAKYEIDISIFAKNVNNIKNQHETQIENEILEM